MYGDAFESREFLPLARGVDPVLFHRGDYGRVIRKHRQHVAASRHSAAVPPVAPTLLKRAPDTRTLRVAYDQLRSRTPGPNSIRPNLLENGERWALCRELAHSVRNGTYAPGKERKIQIPKPGKPGKFRTLTIQGFEDRVVAKAAQLILEPLVETLFSPFSFGFRPKRGRLEALASAIALAMSPNKWLWVSADLEKAFDRVPWPRIEDSVRPYVSAEFLELITKIARTEKGNGIRQGSPLSPLLFNIFAHHQIDRPWQRRHAGSPLLRYADDLLVFGANVEEARALYESLSRQSSGAGTPLKGTIEDSIFDIGAGEAIEWLGFVLQQQDNRLTIRIGENAWARLDWRLDRAHLQEWAPLRASAIVKGWIGQMGPCFDFEDRDAVLHRLRELAVSKGFDEIPSRKSLLMDWGAAWARWHTTFDNQTRLLPDRLHTLKSWALPPAQTPDTNGTR